MMCKTFKIHEQIEKRCLIGENKHKNEFFSQIESCRRVMVTVFLDIEDVNLDYRPKKLGITQFCSSEYFV